MSISQNKFQHILDAIDENIFYKDTQGRYALVTHVCSMLNSNDDPNFTILGKTDMDIQVDKELGKKFYNEDMHIIKTGESLKYIQEMQFGPNTYFYEITKNPVIDDDGSIIGIVGVVKDMTELITLQKKLEHYTITDLMTNTFNRFYYESGKYRENLKYPVCVVMADINNLKFYNDNYGHKEGDVLIKTVVENMQRFLSPKDRLIRFGGDEFLILLQNSTEEEGKTVVQQIKLAESKLKLADFSIETSYGICLANQENELENAIEKADEAMYMMKSASHHLR